MFRSDRLVEWRKKRKLTQEQLAVKVKTTKATVSNYENGHSVPPHETLVAIADVLGVSTDYLLGRTDDPTPPGEKSINISELRGAAEAYLKSHADARLNDALTTIQLIEDEARKLGMSPGDPEFLKMLSQAFELLRMARGQNDK